MATATCVIPCICAFCGETVEVGEKKVVWKCYRTNEPNAKVFFLELHVVCGASLGIRLIGDALLAEPTLKERTTERLAARIGS